MFDQWLERYITLVWFVIFSIVAVKTTIPDYDTAWIILAFISGLSRGYQLRIGDEKRQLQDKESK